MGEIENQIHTIIESLKEGFTTKLDTINPINIPKQKKEIFDFIYNTHYSKSVERHTANPTLIEQEIKGIKRFFKLKKHEIFDTNWSFSNSSTSYARLYGQYLVYKADEYRLVEPENFILNDINVVDNESSYVNIKIKPFEINEGWFFINSENYLGETLIVRMYFSFNINQHKKKILTFLFDLCKELNSRLLPFKLKFEILFSDRNENAVLYFQREHYYLVFHVIRRFYKKYSASKIFANKTLFFAKKIYPGLFFAENPIEEQRSFGQIRSKLLTNAFIKNYKQANVLKAVVRDLKKEGYKIEEFYRNPNTDFPYSFNIFENNYEYQSSNPMESKYKLWALNIGKILCKQALIFSKNNVTYCHWVSAKADEYNTNLINYRIVDDSFMNGKLGIIFFLANLHYLFPEDWIIKDICEIVLKTVEKNKENSKFRKRIKAILDYKTEYGSGINEEEKKQLKNIYDSLFASRQPLNNSIINAEEITKKLEQRMVYSYLPNDAFIATFDDFGYALIGQMLLQMDDTSEINNYNLQSIHDFVASVGI